MNTSEDNAKKKPSRKAISSIRKIVFIYASCSCLWILFSDKTVGWLISDPATVTLVSTVKGWIFVAVTSLLIYGLLRRLIDQLQAASQREQVVQEENARIHQLLNAIVDNSGDAIFAKDLHGRYLLFNSETARVTGKAASLALHEDDHAIFPRSQAEQIQANDKRVIAEDKIVTYEEMLSTTDGERTFLAKKGPLRNSEGRVIGMFGIARDVTEQRRAESSLSYAVSLANAALESTTDAILIVHRDGRIARWNQRFVDLWNVPAHLLDTTVNDPVLSHVTAQIKESQAFLEKIALLNEHLELTSFDTLYLLDGRIVERYSQAQKIGDEIIGRFWSFRDATERKRTEEDLRIAATAFDSQESIYITDINRVILRVNRAFAAKTGYAVDELIGQPLSMLRSDRHDDEFYRNVWETVRRDGKWEGEVWDKHKDGKAHPKWSTVSTVTNDAGVQTHFVGMQHDIEEQKRAEETIRHLAFYDQLTGLPNRTLLQDRLKKAMAASARSENFCALLLIDLDNFKTLNDTRGHDMGDVLLKQVAHRLTEAVREEDTVSRLGGDEFVVLLIDLGQDENEAAAHARFVGEKIQAALNQRYQLKEISYRMTSSIGACQFIGQRVDMDLLLKQADLAMYKAKDAGRNTLRFFDPAMEKAVLIRATQETELRDAIQQQQFVLHYQVQVAGNQAIGAEALVRWEHPSRGLVSPGEFIPLAEEAGLIRPLGSWVLETACTQLALWAKRHETANLSIAVNVSAQQFHHDDFVRQVLATLKSTGANPERLKLELTESLLVSNMNVVIDKMFALKAEGVRFSLDDFGTGYSSLSYLKRLPLDQLKIDQSFVRDVLSDSNDASIVRTIIALASSLGLGVIAEGVETATQRDFLAESGCRAYQGYLFGRPLAIEEFEQSMACQ